MSVAAAPAPAPAPSADRDDSLGSVLAALAAGYAPAYAESDLGAEHLCSAR